MSDKPSLYVVEKKEVVILVVLFILVTVLAFTMGVRYGESVGKKAALEHEEAEKAVGGAEAEKIGGKLGASSEKVDHAGGHGAPDAAKPEEAAKHDDSHGANEHSEAHGKAAVSAPLESKAAPPPREISDKNSDEYLLDALKESEVEPPGGKPPAGAKLPEEIKKPRSGGFVVQVGSHPTRAEAESQVRSLRQKKVSAEILPAFKDRQGEWHRVVIGGFRSKRDAEKEAARLKNSGLVISFFVWRLP